MSAPNQFENLMNQYSREAVVEQERSERAARRSRLIKTIIKTCLILLLFAAAAGAYLYRAPISTKLGVLKLKSFGQMQAERKANAEAKAVEAQKLGQKRVQEFEATIK